MILINGEPYTTDVFPDSTRKYTLLKNYDPGVIDVTWCFDDDSETLTLYYICRHLREIGCILDHLWMPYVPNARMDRVKTDEEVFMLKYFAELINYLGFNSVVILDPHSNVTPALIRNVRVLSPKPYIQTAVDEIDAENLVLFYPDEGAMKRYSEMVKHPYLFGVKNRDWSTGVIRSLDVIGDTSLVRDNPVLIVDDICCRGGTFLSSAVKLRELGASKVYLYVTHCENTMLDGLIPKSDLIDRVYTTDSLFTKQHEKVRVLQIVSH